MKKAFILCFTAILTLLSFGHTFAASNFPFFENHNNDQINDCSPPNVYALRYGNVTYTSVTIYWYSDGTANKWSIGYCKEGHKDFTYVEVDVPQVTLTGLDTGTAYIYKVASICSETEMSSYTSTKTFYTKDLCPLPGEPEFKEVPDNSSMIAMVWKPYGDEELWQVCYGKTGTSTFDTLPLLDTPYVLITGLKYNTPYTIKLRAVCGDNLFSKWLTMPVYTFDYQCVPPKNLTFSDITDNSAHLEWVPGTYEKSWTIQYKDENDNWSNPETIKTQFYTFNQLKRNTTYTVKLFSNCSQMRESDIIEASFTTTASDDTCKLPTDIAISDIALTSAVVTWKQASDSANRWDVFYRRYKTLDWATAAADQPSYTLTDLRPETEYEVAVVEYCKENLVSSLTEPVRFKTAEEVKPCDVPTDLAVSDIDKNSATVSWKYEKGTANNWSVYYKISGVDHWTDSLAAATTSATLGNLDPVTEYEVAVAAHCTTGLTSELSESIVFTTKEDGIDDYGLSQHITLYPNPTTGMININDETGLAAAKTIDVCDIYGRILKTMSTSDDNISISVADYADGIYFVRISTEQGMAHKTFIKK